MIAANNIGAVNVICPGFILTGIMGAAGAGVPGVWEKVGPAGVSLVSSRTGFAGE